MISIRSRLLAGAAASVLLTAAAHAETPVSPQSSFLLAQAEGTSPAEAEPAPVSGPVAAAEKAVEDARAALRDAMATGGNVYEARRNLQAAIKKLNETRTAAGLAPVEGGTEVATPRPETPPADAGAPPPDLPNLAAPAGPPPETAPSEAPPVESPPAAPPVLSQPETPSPDTPTLAQPEPPAAAPPTPPAQPEATPPVLSQPEAQPPETPTLAQPEPPAAAPPTPPAQPEATPPAQPPTLATPETPPQLTPPQAAAPPATPAPEVASPTTPTTPPETASKEPTPPPPPPATQGETPATPPVAGEQGPALKEKQPGFFERLFGRDKNQSGQTEQAAAPPAGSPAEPGKTEGPPPIFKKLPPIEGPKVVSVAPGETEVVKQEDEKRVIVKEGDQITIKHDDNDRFRRRGENIKIEEGKGGTTITTVIRDNGTQVVTIRDKTGDILQRYRKKKNGEVEVLIGDRERDGRPRQGWRERLETGPGPQRDFEFDRNLPKLVVKIPQEQYIVRSQGASRSQLEDVLIAPPVEAIERPYSLEEIRGSERIRAKLRRIDVDTVNFEFGAATIAEDQIPSLEAIGNALADIIADDPSEVFMIEGHTDAVGSDLSNLSLSDRRAESIAEILTYYFNIPPENLVTQGYGEQYLKVLTAGPERQNRRAGVRRITPLLAGQL